jgi:parvulin-like peptidyl-prolyl isomerase
MFENEERRQSLLIFLFIGLIVLLVVGLVAAFALDYYDQNLRPVANVGGTDIGPGLVRSRTILDQLRLSRDEGRYRVLQQTNEITAVQASNAVDGLNSKAQAITADSVKEELIDLLYQNILAGQESVSPSAADVAAAVDKEFTTPEQRHFLIISVKPDSTGSAAPTIQQRQAAIDKANQALAEVQAGTDWATVAKEFSSDPSAANGGDGGTISASNPVDPSWTKALFALPEGGTTGVVASLGCARSDAGDCLYQIGRVTAITPGGPDTAYHDKVLAKMSADDVRQIVGWELAADRLRDKITATAISGPVDQVHLAEIIIRNTEASAEQDQDPTADQGEVHFAQILFAPNDDPSNAASVPAIDPAWAKAENDANAAFAQLNAITDPKARSDQFATMASASSDDEASKADGGNVAFSARSLLPSAVAAALFDTPHVDGDLLGPIKDENGYYVLLFHEHRGSPKQRLDQLKADIAANKDWNTLVTTYSDGTDTDKANGGDIGWFTQDMLKTVEKDTVAKIFALQAGQVSDPIVFGTDSYVFKALDHTSRPLDPNQVAQLEDPDYGAYATWYSDKKDEATANHIIVRPGEEPAPTDTAAPS